MDKHVLIAAGGLGTRMASSQAKQFANICKRPVLLRVLDAFLKYAADIHLVVVLPEKLHREWQSICQKHRFHVRHQLVIGGPTRFHSVKNGLKHIPDNALVAIHDAARPLVSLDLISRVFYFAGKFGNAIPATEVNESLRITDHAMSSPLPRQRIRIIQTPQCFKSSLIKNAYNKNYQESFTDDASVLESEGERLFLIEGNRQNMKITHQADLLVAEALFSARRP